jgi:hypothetical protein
LFPKPAWVSGVDLLFSWRTLQAIDCGRDHLSPPHCGPDNLHGAEVNRHLATRFEHERPFSACLIQGGKVVFRRQVVNDLVVGNHVEMTIGVSWGSRCSAGAPSSAPSSSTPCVMPLGVASAWHDVVVASVALRCAVRSGSARLRLRWSDVVGVGPQAWRLPCGKWKTLKKEALFKFGRGAATRVALEKSTKFCRGILVCLPGPQHPHSPAPA